ncbi:MAG: sulfite exporter TauE/SafE family protein [Lachnospiraceae bacterium]
MKTIIFLLVIFFANAIQAITGFAGTVLAMPPSILLVGMDEAKVVLSFMAFLSCLIITIQNRKEINRKEMTKMSSFMLVGMVVGIWIYTIVEPDILLPIYGIIVVLVGVKNLVLKKEMKLNQYALITVLLIAGIIHGMFVSGGALLVIYAASVLKDKNEFRATIAPVWVVLNSILFASYIASGLVTASNIKLILMSIVPLFVATYVGNVLQTKIKQEYFMKLTYVLLILSGLSIL